MKILRNKLNLKYVNILYFNFVKIQLVMENKIIKFTKIKTTPVLSFDRRPATQKIPTVRSFPTLKRTSMTGYNSIILLNFHE